MSDQKAMLDAFRLFRGITASSLGDTVIRMSPEWHLYRAAYQAGHAAAQAEYELQTKYREYEARKPK